MAEADPRATLERLIRDRGEDYAGLSRLIGRNAAYIQQYIKRGSPRRLAEDDRRQLAAYFGIDEALLGAPPAPAPRGDAGLVSVSPEGVRHRLRSAISELNQRASRG